ncbi:MAG: 2,4-diaminopentanoate dehydrogenase [Firmicutes bacterium]|nr:2,4-diaminopentanoate dehydrogenase [Bacillota bacterium]MDH7495491.1 2,4-diaminopentanoate dehydrogenase [Bacillota bacterium]
MDEITVVCWGLGAMGSGMARALLERKGVRIVGAIATRPDKAGRDLGDVLNAGRDLGVRVTNDPDEALEAGADVVLHATSSFAREIYPQLDAAMAAGSNVITVAEEMAYLRQSDPGLAAEIDQLARKYGVSVLGTGINPGFVLDTLIIGLTGICTHVKRVKARRVNDLSPFGPTVMRTQGVGTTVEEFREGLEKGSIVGHIGFIQSCGMIADALGWRLDEITQTREPIVSNTRRTTPYVDVKPGMVAGCNHTAHAFMNGEEVITLEHPQQVLPGLEGVETGDYIWIEGTPPVNLAIKPEIPGGIGTIAIAVNMIPQVVEAEPGLVTMKDLRVPACAMGDMASLARTARGDGESVRK